MIVVVETTVINLVTNQLYILSYDLRNLNSLDLLTSSFVQVNLNN